METTIETKFVVQQTFDTLGFTHHSTHLTLEAAAEESEKVKEMVARLISEQEIPRQKPPRPMIEAEAWENALKEVGFRYENGVLVGATYENKILTDSAKPIRLDILTAREMAEKAVAIEQITGENVVKIKAYHVTVNNSVGGGTPIYVATAVEALKLAVENELDVIGVGTERAECPESFEVEVTVTNLADHTDAASKILTIPSVDAEDGEEARITKTA